MKKRTTVEQKILRFLKRSPDTGFLRSEFDRFAKSRSGVDKALRKLVKENKLIRCGYGVLARAEYNDLFDRYNPKDGLETVAEEVLRKLGVDTKPNSAVVAYNKGRSTQIPVWIAYEIGNSRIKRKIYFRKGMVNYERNGKWVPMRL
ncbi:DUF6088 family protein [Acidithiobacillus sp. IBUN Pt1247-S3]|uniref:DUF6088 family protein n=1 Tax=Acidithiobacillus sp. IBUN Pt1247-S3 TaxID=3166642 RepID=UPI0034E402FE